MPRRSPGEAAPFALSDEMREQLQRLLRSKAAGSKAAKKIRGLLLLAEGLPVGVIARRMQVAPSTVLYWRQAFEARGLGALSGPAAGGPRK